MGRLLTIVFAAAVLAVLVLKLLDVKDFADNVDTTAVALLILAVLLGFVAFAPGEAKETLKRVTSFKVGGFEVGMQAATRVERVESRVERIEAVIEDDDVDAVKPRPVGGSAAEEFDAVRDKLEERLRYVRDVIFVLGEGKKTIEVVDEINKRELLELDEMQVVRDLLGNAKEEVDQLEADVRRRYLDGGWRFASRFATLVFERCVRKAMVEKKWLLLDFNQTRGHRPDFIAFREQVCLVATRVEPAQTKKTRGRLSRQVLPFDAKRLVVYPDRHERAAGQVTNEFQNVELVKFSDLEQAAATPKT